MSNFGVGPAKERALFGKMARLGVRKEDILESFIRSSGPGGQKVNKTSTCVYLKHLPTQIEVKCQKERSQALNRYFARVFLLKKIEAFFEEKLSLQREERERMRRQKRRRSSKAKLKNLEAKRRHAEKKRLRAKIKV